MNKYVKLNSLTWWAAFVPLCLGVFMATEPMHHMADAVLAVRNATGMTAPILINAGLAGIGLRGAVGA